jgi:hypothetical protein
MKQLVRLDAPFWLAVLAGLLAVGSMLCFGLAAAAQRELVGAQVLVVDGT